MLPARTRARSWRAGSSKVAKTLTIKADLDRTAKQNITIFLGEALTLTVRVSAAVDLSVKEATAANPIVITTLGEHGLATNDRVFVAGVLGVTTANGNHAITKVDSDQFSLNSVDGSSDPAYGGGGVITPLRDLSTDTAEWKLKAHELTDSAVAALISKATGGSGITLSNGEMAIVIAAADTASLEPRVMYHEVRLTDTNNLPVTVATGAVSLRSTII